LQVKNIFIRAARACGIEWRTKQEIVRDEELFESYFDRYDITGTFGVCDHEEAEVKKFMNEYPEVKRSFIQAMKDVDCEYLKGDDVQEWLDKGNPMFNPDVIKPYETLTNKVAAVFTKLDALLPMPLLPGKKVSTFKELSDSYSPDNPFTNLLLPSLPKLKQFVQVYKQTARHEVQKKAIALVEEFLNQKISAEDMYDRAKKENCEIGLHFLTDTIRASFVRPDTIPDSCPARPDVLVLKQDSEAEARDIGRHAAKVAKVKLELSKLDPNDQQKRSELELKLIELLQLQADNDFVVAIGDAISAKDSVDFGYIRRVYYEQFYPKKDDLDNITEKQLEQFIEDATKTVKEIANKGKRKEYDAELKQIAADLQEMQDEFKAALNDPVAQKLSEGIIRQTEIMQSHIPYDDIIKYRLDRLFFLLDVGSHEVPTVMNAYDISPGEAYLEWCHSYPPILHTYEELPLLKEYIEKEPHDKEGHHKEGHKEGHLKEGHKEGHKEAHKEAHH